MKKIAIVCILMALGWSLSAGPVTVDRALELAGRVLPAVDTRAAEPLKVIWDGETAPTPEAPALYVIGRESGGFVILAGDDRVCPVLAISDKGRFEVEGMPANVRWWMDQMKAYVRSVPAPEAGAAEAWAPGTRATAALPESGVTDKVERLTPEWDQGNNDQGYFGRNVFNAMCPRSGSNLCITGCVAVAVAEVLTYESGQAGVVMPSASHGTITESEYKDPARYHGGITPTLPYSFSTTYDWAGLRSLSTVSAVRAALNAGNTTLIDNLGQLLADLGAADYAEYAVGETSASVQLGSLAEHFDMNKRAHIEKQADYTTRQWISMLKAEIDQRPVLVSGKTVAAVGQYTDGSPYYAGHQFVFDGYGTYGDETVFHVNFGWGGNCNGYYRHTNLDSNTDFGGRKDYSRNMDAVFGFYPDAGSTYLPVLTLGSLTFNNGMVVNGLHADREIVSGQMYYFYYALWNRSASAYSGPLRIIQESKDGELKGTLYTNSDFSLVPGRASGYGFGAYAGAMAFGDRIVLQYASAEAPDGWAYPNYADDGTVFGEWPLVPAAFIRTEESYAVGDYFTFRIRNCKTLYAGTVWSVTAPDGTRTSYTQADREFRLTQAGKYKIEAAIAPAAGETVTERVVAVITVQ